MATAARRAANIAQMEAAKAASGSIAAPGVVQPVNQVTPITNTPIQSPISQVGGAVTRDGIVTQNGTTVINPQSLSGSTPVKIPETVPSTTATGIIGTVEGIKDASISAQQAKLEQAKIDAQNTQNADRTALTDTMNQILGIQTGSEQARQDAGIDTKTQTVNTYTNQLDSLQRKQQNEIRALEGSNLTDAQKSAKINEINRASAFEQADVAVLQAAANRDLATAQTILDSKTKLELEPLQTKLQFQKLFYDENKDLLSKADDRAFNNSIKETDAKIKIMADFEKTKSDYALQALKDGNINLFKALNNATDTKSIAAAVISNSNNGSINANTAPEYTKALSVILGSGKFTKEQKADVTNAINNGEDPFTVIKNKAKDIMGQTLATSLDKYETAKKQLQSIDGLLKDFYTNGGKTGYFTGNFEKTLNKLGEVNDPKLVDIATNIAAALQIYRNAVSGTAYSVQEGQDIASIFPGINKSQGLNNAIISGRLKAFDTSIDSQYENTLGSIYNTLKETNAEVKDTNEQSKTTLNNFITKNPSKVGQLYNDIQTMEEKLKRKATPDEILQVYPEYKQ